MLLLVLECIFGLERAYGLVRMQGTGLFAIGFIEVVEGSRRLDPYEVVESDILALVSNDFVAETKDLVI